MKKVKMVIITEFEGLQKGDYPKEFNSLVETSTHINSEDCIDGKVWFQVESNEWDTYSGRAYKAYKEGKDRGCDLHDHIRSHCIWVMNEEHENIKEEDRKRAREWLEIISN